MVWPSLRILTFIGNFAKTFSDTSVEILRKEIHFYPSVRPVLCWRGRFNNAALLLIRRHGEHRLEDGVNRRAVAYPSEPGDEGSIDAGRRIPHRIPRAHRRQGQRQDADLLAARQAGFRQGAPQAATP